MLNNYKIIALCLSGIQEAVNIEFLSELNSGLSNLGYRIFVYDIGTDLYWNETNDDSQTLVFELIDYAVVDAVIIMDEKIKDRLVSHHIISNARNANVPVIIIDGQYEGCMNVLFDYKAGFEKIVRHVMDIHAPKRPHFMAGNRDNKFSDERKEVFRRVIEENGFTFDESMVSYGDFWAKPTIKAMQKLIDRNEVPDAVICANDVMAINVIATLKRNGYDVPNDVIVTGFDGIEEIHLTEPKITSSICDYAKLADKVIELIIENETKGDYFVEPISVISESCGCKYCLKLNILNNVNMLNSRFYRYQYDNHKLMRIAEKIQNSTGIEDIPVEMDHWVMNHVSCFLNTWCKDVSIDPMNAIQKSFDDDMYLIYEACEEKPFVPRNFKRKDIIPNFNQILDRKYPIVFAELAYLNVPIGYVCFSYNSCDGTYYKKIPYIVSALNNGIGGFLNKRYQNYLVKRVEHIYIHDGLTGLYNRLGFNNEFDRMMNDAKGKKEKITVALADLDGLKSINDNYGHAAGDEAIHTVAVALKHSCPKEALCVRFGGDEMLAVIEGDYDSDLLRNKMHQFLDDYNGEKNNPYIVSASLGILQIEGSDITDFEGLLKEVDKLMYEDKRRKRNKSRT